MAREVFKPGDVQILVYKGVRPVIVLDGPVELMDEFGGVHYYLALKGIEKVIVYNCVLSNGRGISCLAISRDFYCWKELQRYIHRFD